MFGEFKRQITRIGKPRRDVDLPQRRSDLLSNAMMAFQVATCLIHVSHAFARAGIHPFQPEALFKSELVISPAEILDTSLPQKWCRGPRISGTILTNKQELPAIQYYVPPSITYENEDEDEPHDQLFVCPE